jgi:hypothetical protein
MSQFSQAADFFSRAFDAQSRAANAQQFMQQPGLEDTTYTAEQSSNPAGAPVAPKFGEYGTIKEDDFRVEEIKRDMLRRSIAKRDGANGVEVRAGGGSPSESLS